jgi:hypothetical protein
MANCHLDILLPKCELVVHIYLQLLQCHLALGTAHSRSGDILADEEEDWGVTRYADLLLFTGNRTIAIGS